MTVNPDSRGLAGRLPFTATDIGVDTTTTDINGHYLFTDLTDLTDGTYRVWIAVESTTSAS